MTLVRANPLGWALFEILLSAQMNLIDSQLPSAVDGSGGGLYQLTDAGAPTNPGTITLTGAAFSTAIPVLDIIGGGTGTGAVGLPFRAVPAFTTSVTPADQGAAITGYGDMLGFNGGAAGRGRAAHFKGASLDASVLEAVHIEHGGSPATAPALLVEGNLVGPMVTINSTGNSGNAILLVDSTNGTPALNAIVDIAAASLGRVNITGGGVSGVYVTVPSNSGEINIIANNNATFLAQSNALGDALVHAQQTAADNAILQATSNTGIAQLNLTSTANNVTGQYTASAGTAAHFVTGNISRIDSTDGTNTSQIRADASGANIIAFSAGSAQSSVKAEADTSFATLQAVNSSGTTIIYAGSENQMRLNFSHTGPAEGSVGVATYQDVGTGHDLYTDQIPIAWGNVTLVSGTINGSTRFLGCKPNTAGTFEGNALSLTLDRTPTDDQFSVVITDKSQTNPRLCTFQTIDKGTGQRDFQIYLWSDFSTQVDLSSVSETFAFAVFARTT